VRSVLLSGHALEVNLMSRFSSAAASDGTVADGHCVDLLGTPGFGSATGRPELADRYGARYLLAPPSTQAG